jgi:hypothetical protein
VVVKFKLHKALEFRNEPAKFIRGDGSILERKLGNVTEETDITFEYTLKKVSKLVEMEDVDLENLKTLPFQAQISYTAKDGSKCLKVISTQLSLNSDREAVEKEADLKLIGQHAIQQSTKMAQAGNHREAQAYAKNWNRKIRNVNQGESSNLAANFNEVYNQLGELDQQQSKGISKKSDRQTVQLFAKAKMSRKAYTGK